MELQREKTEQHEHEQHGSVIEWAVARQQTSETGGPALIPVVKATPNGILICLIDGLGQGPEAQNLAHVAEELMKEYTHQSLTELFGRCDNALRGTSGVSMTAAIISTGMNMVSWFGVGNVQATLFHRSPVADPRCHWLDRFNGVVGNSQYSFREMRLQIKPGDLLILATEGFGSDFTSLLPIDGKPRGVADQLLAAHARPETDSLIVVVRYMGHQ